MGFPIQTDTMTREFSVLPSYLETTPTGGTVSTASTISSSHGGHRVSVVVIQRDLGFYSAGREQTRFWDYAPWDAPALALFCRNPAF